jgi:hypothetical protein
MMAKFSIGHRLLIWGRREFADSPLQSVRFVILNEVKNPVRAGLPLVLESFEC